MTNLPAPQAFLACPIVIADGDAVVVSYSIPSHPTDTPTTAPLSIVQFHRPRFHLFIASNEAAIKGHPLSGRGLSPYGIFKVDHSSLVRRLEQIGCVRSYADPSACDSLTHYILTFGDSIFECVAESLDVTIEQVGFDEEYDRTLQILKAS